MKVKDLANVCSAYFGGITIIGERNKTLFEFECLKDPLDIETVFIKTVLPDDILNMKIIDIDLCTDSYIDYGYETTRILIYLYVKE